MSEDDPKTKGRIIELAAHRAQIRARKSSEPSACRLDATRDVTVRGGPKRYVIELTVDRPLYEKLLLAKLLLSDRGEKATLHDVVEIALEVWLGEFGRPPCG